MRHEEMRDWEFVVDAFMNGSKSLWER